MESIIFPDKDQNINSSNYNFHQRAKEHIFNSHLSNNHLENEREKEVNKLTEDYIICPYQKCGNIFNGFLSVENKIRLENQNIYCDGCNQFYRYFLCIYCKQKIYYFPDEDIIGFNIKCPYNTCKKEFFKINCGGCGILLNFKNSKCENSIIKCNNKACGKETSFIRCPIKKCKNLNIFTKEKASKLSNNSITNLIEFIYDNENYGLLNKNIICNNKACNVNFTKLKCIKCNFINFIFSIDYYEGVEITCQNNDCRVVFKKISCPLCNEEINYFKNLKNKENELKANYEKINVNDFVICGNIYCKANFSKINCPECKKDNIVLGRNKFLEGKKIKCVNNLCNVEFSFYCCNICSDILFWKNSNIVVSNKDVSKDNFNNKNKSINIRKEFKRYEKYIDVYQKKIQNEMVSEIIIEDCYIRGQPVFCFNCEFNTSKINCPFCNEIINLFADSCIYGVNYNCFNLLCMKRFYINFCLCCKKTKIKKGKRQYDKFLTCPSFDDKNREKERNSIDFIKDVISGNHKTNCENRYDFFYCIDCNSILFYYEKDYVKNKALKCPTENCKNIFYLLNCFECFQKISIKEDSLNEFNTLICSNRYCNKNIKFIYCNKCNLITNTNLKKEEYLKSIKSIQQNFRKNERKGSFNEIFICENYCNKNIFEYSEFELFNQNNLSFGANDETFINNRNEIGCNFLEDEKGYVYYNIFKKIIFRDGFKLNNPLYYLDESQIYFNKMLEMNKSKQIHNLYSGVPPNYESNYFFYLRILLYLYFFIIFI